MTDTSSGQTYVFYGTSSSLEAMQAFLEARTGLAVQQVQPGADDALEALNPDMVLFDMAGGVPDALLCLLRKIPTMRLIGVDLAERRLTAISGRQASGATPPALLEAIQACPLPTAWDKRFYGTSR